MKQKNENKKANPNIEITNAVPNRAHTEMKSQTGMKTNQGGQNQSGQNNSAKSSKSQNCK